MFGLLQSGTGSGSGKLPNVPSDVDASRMAPLGRALGLPSRATRGTVEGVAGAAPSPAPAAPALVAPAPPAAVRRAPDVAVAGAVVPRLLAVAVGAEAGVELVPPPVLVAGVDGGAGTLVFTFTGTGTPATLSGGCGTSGTAAGSSAVTVGRSIAPGPFAESAATGKASSATSPTAAATPIGRRSSTAFVQAHGGLPAPDRQLDLVDEAGHEPESAPAFTQ